MKSQSTIGRTFFNKKSRVYQYGVLIVVLLLIVVSITFGAPPTRQLSELPGNDYGTDTIYTMIRNSNGKYWSATGANIQLAMDDLTGGGIVYLPNGTFEPTSPLTFNYNNIKIQGSGVGSTIINGVSGMSTSEDFFYMVQKNNITICDLTIDCNTYGRHGIDIVGSDYVFIDNVVINNVYLHAIYSQQRFTGYVNSTNIFISNIVVDGMNSGAETHGIAISQTDGFLIDNVVLKDNSLNWPVDITRSKNGTVSNVIVKDSDYGMKVVGTSGENSERISINGFTTVNGGDYWGFRTEYTKYCNFNNFQIEGHNIGMYLYGSSTNNNYNNINIENSGSGGVACMYVRSVDCTFNNVFISNPQSTSDGIVFYEAHDCILSNVHIRNSLSDGITFDASYNITLNGGIIDTTSFNGIRFDNTNYGFSIHGFDFRNIGWDALDAAFYNDPVHNFTISGCSFGNLGVAGTGTPTDYVFDLSSAAESYVITNNRFGNFTLNNDDGSLKEVSGNLA